QHSIDPQGTLSVSERIACFSVGVSRNDGKEIRLQWGWSSLSQAHEFFCAFAAFCRGLTTLSQRRLATTVPSLREQKNSEHLPATERKSRSSGAPADFLLGKARQNALL